MLYKSSNLRSFEVKRRTIMMPTWIAAVATIIAALIGGWAGAQFGWVKDKKERRGQAMWIFLGECHSSVDDPIADADVSDYKAKEAYARERRNRLRVTFHRAHSAAKCDDLRRCVKQLMIVTYYGQSMNPPLKYKEVLGQLGIDKAFGEKDGFAYRVESRESNLHDSILKKLAQKITEKFS